MGYKGTMEMGYKGTMESKFNLNESDVDAYLVDKNKVLSSESKSTLEYTLKVMGELTHWLVKSGIGYSEFSNAIRPLFYNEAIKELEHLGQKKTDSSISLLSGLNRRDVGQIKQENGGQHTIIHLTCRNTMPISVPARVVALWVHKDLPYILPLTSNEKSFDWLVKQISRDKHPRSILLELQRIGLVTEIDGKVILHQESFTPAPEAHQAKQILAENLSDHIAAGVYNLTENQNYFLEQAIFANELTEESINYLKERVVELWGKFSKSLLAEAIELCQKDEGQIDANRRFRVGIFEYDTIDINKN